MMTLQINGDAREFPDGLNISGLVAQLGMKPDRVAVELNLEIVPRSAWRTQLSKTATSWRLCILLAGSPAA